MKSPVKAALKTVSSLQTKVQEGLGALTARDKQFVEEAVRPSFADSLEIDENLKQDNDQANRWDYLLGHAESAQVVGLEPHSAYTKEVRVVVAKKKAALQQLRKHLNSGVTVSAWFWVASGRVDFVPHEKIVRRLDQEGITFVGGVLRAKHLPKKPATKRSGA